MTAPEVTVEPYDFQNGLDWIARRGRVFTAGDYRVWVSDCGHVDLSHGSVHDVEAGPSLAQAEALLAALTAAVAAARQAAADYAAPAGPEKWEE